MVARKTEDIFPSNFFCQPWIIQCHGANKHTTSFIDPMKTDIEEKEIVEMKGKLCFGCAEECLFLWDEQTKECFFLDLNSLSKIHLPPLPKEDIMFSSFSLSSSPNHPNCTVILHGMKFDWENQEILECFLMRCQPYDAKWNKNPLDQEDIIIGSSSVILGGKLYMCSFDSVIVFDVISLLTGQVDKRTISTPKDAQYYPWHGWPNTYLVESCGLIYLVRMYDYGGGPTNYIDIYCLDTSSDKWLRIDSIGDRAFFLSDKCCKSVCALDAGVEGNCIYYTSSQRYVRRMYKFCMDDHTMAFNLASTEDTEYESTFCWFVPTRPNKKIMGSSVSLTKALNQLNEDKLVVEKKITSNISRPWNDLPLDLVELLLPHLSLVDALRLFTVCKEWNLTSNLIQKVKTWPWFMYQEKMDGMCKLIDPLNGKEYTTRVGFPSFVFPTQMICSKDGWIIMLDEARAMFLVNPLNQDIVKLPCLEEFDQSSCGIALASVSTLSDCVVLRFCINSRHDTINFYKWHNGDEDWTLIYDEESPFRTAANTNPVFFHGELYCLAESGKLGVFNPVEETWRILDKPKSVYMEDEVPFRGNQDCYLLELDENLVSVFKANYADNDIRIFKLDSLKMEWIPVKDLAGWTLFLDPRGSFAKSSLHKSWSNKILFTAFHSGTTKTCVTYCMERKRYDISFCEARKPLNCVWFEPNMIRKSF
ncbi:F-box protein family-like [Rhynchospora pubera]|uniref:F-box protein family-like n=1 Tax=Rhynchospora pubera TaxID=906938 RepID=A0AAV8H6F2_9POAL|nr:F-box protein family-like [Rhynchospora pubera]